MISKATFLISTAALFTALCGQDISGSRYPIYDSKPDARIQGLGGNAVTLEKHLGASFENPALASSLRSLCLKTAHINLFFDQKLYSAAIGAGTLFGDLGWAVEWRQLNGGRYRRAELLYDADGNPLIDESWNMAIDSSLGDFSDITNGVTVCGGVSMPGHPALRFGVAGKLIARSLNGTLKYGLGLDIGSYYSLRNSTVRFGAIARDVAIQVLNDSTEAEYRRIIEFGVSFLALKNTLQLAAGLENLDHRHFDGRFFLGVEWHLLKPFVLRCGINNEYLSLGAGLFFGPLIVNYSVVNYREWGYDDPHRITIEYYLGGKSTL